MRKALSPDFEKPRVTAARGHRSVAQGETSERRCVVRRVARIGNPDGPPFSKASWVADFADPTNFFDVLFHSRMIAAENSNNWSFYANPDLDALLDAARAEQNATKREAMYFHAERILYDDAPWIWDYHQMTTEVVQPYVRGYAPHPVWLRDYSSAWLDVGADGKPVPR